jgi:hypothetical protein
MFYEIKRKIEHQIILDEYLAFKRVYSEILQKNISKYNFKSLRQLNFLLEKLRKTNIEHYLKFKKDVQEEYKDEIISKYEYWVDSPYRTRRKNEAAIKNTETSLLELIYGTENKKQ